VNYARKLPQSIVAKAFRGELVTTEAELAKAEGREYEAAEQLLARIKHERATHKEMRGRSRKGSRAKAHL
jgi:type I restriction enzyme S subunit